MSEKEDSEGLVLNAAVARVPPPLPDALARIKGTVFLRWIGPVERGSGQRSPQLTLSLSQRGVNGVYAQPQPLLVPAAFAADLRIGDCYADGALVSRSTSSKYAFNLQIDPELLARSVSSLAEKKSPLLGSYLVDYEHYENPRGYAATQALSLELGPNSWMLVPCWELIRFYFGRSGLLLGRLLRDTWKRSDLGQCRYDEERRAHWLDMAPGFNGYAAQTIARILLDRHAESAAHWISNSRTKAAAENTPWYPRANFPFKGKTDLVAQGKWLKPFGCEVFLVERIVSCTHPFPFDKLICPITEGSAIAADSADGRSLRVRRSSRPRSLKLGQADVRPGTSTTVKLSTSDEEIAFPDLEDKQLNLFKAKNRPANVAGSHGEPIAGHDGETKNSADSVRAEMSFSAGGNVTAAQLKRPPDFLLAAVARINELVPYRISQTAIASLKGFDGTCFDRISDLLTSATDSPFNATILSEWPHDKQIFCLVRGWPAEDESHVNLALFRVPANNRVDGSYIAERLYELDAPLDRRTTPAVETLRANALELDSVAEAIERLFSQ